MIKVGEYLLGVPMPFGHEFSLFFQLYFAFFALGNIAPEKVPTFLIAALLLVGIGAALQQDFFVNLKYIGPYFTNIAAMLAVFIAPAAGLLAIRAIWDAGKSEEIEKVLPKIK